MKDSCNGIKRISRRNFIRTCTAVTAVAGTALSLPGCNNNTISGEATHSRKSILNKGSTILFQGDSITDAGRNKGREDNVNDSAALGKGYAYLTAAQLLADRPGHGLGTVTTAHA